MGREDYLIGQKAALAQSLQVLQVETSRRLEGSLILRIATEIQYLQKVPDTFRRAECLLEYAASNLLLVCELRHGLDQVVKGSPMRGRPAIWAGDGEQSRD